MGRPLLTSVRAGGLLLLSCWSQAFCNPINVEHPFLSVKVRQRRGGGCERWCDVIMSRYVRSCCWCGAGGGHTEQLGPASAS